MNRIAQTLLGSAVIILVLALAGSPGSAGAATMNDFCITPSFIQASVPANMLLMIDNSSSMYDLANIDTGKKHCSVSTAKACTYNYDCSYCSTTTARKCYVNADCPGSETCNTSETCSVFDRQPSYCYDESYQSTHRYSGYFTPTTPPDADGHTSTVYYYYRAASDDFAVLADAFPGPCTATKSIANTMCVQYDAGTTPPTLQQFVASGNYLNWLTASKQDVQKKILTGGKYMTKTCSVSKAACFVDADCVIPTGQTCDAAASAYLKAESRGCVGQGFVKNALTTDFVNFTGTSSENPNTPLGVTFRIRSEPNPNNKTAPYAGGQTYIDLFSVPGKTYDYASCEGAYKAIASGTNADIKQEVGACLADSAPGSGFCQQKTDKTCTTSSNCMFNPALAQTATVCSGNPSITCTSDANCRVIGGTCTGRSTLTCTSDTNCTVDVAEQLGTCSTLSTSYAPAFGTNDRNFVKTTCRTDADCNFSHGNSSFVAKAGTCGGHVAASSTSYGTCQNTTNDWSPCSTNYVGPCVTTAAQAEVKTKVSFQQSMQACWQARGTCSNNSAAFCYANADCGAGNTCNGGHAIGTDEITTVDNQCSDVYGGYATCSNNSQQFCRPDGSDAAAVCGAGNSCVTGPAAIAAGNAALLCGTTYEGKFYQQVSGAWVKMTSLPSPTPTGCAATDTVEDCMKKIHTLFCSANVAPNVVDPTDSPSNTATAENVPAILSGISVEAQLGMPTKSMRVKVATDAAPAGLIQQFADKIRIGAMSFNYNGSATEAGSAMPVPNVCSNDPNKSCTVALDCGNSALISCNPTVANTSNLDGGKVLYNVGYGKCYNMANTPPTLALTIPLIGSPYRCTTDRTCTAINASYACVPDGAGDHTSAGTLVRTIDDIVANAWTPFAEAFYDAIGYYAIPMTCNGAGVTACETDAECGGTNKCTWNSTGESRTDLRLNTGDFDPAFNPSNVKCQKNFVLLISDGMSTADRKDSVTSLAELYTAAGGETTTSATAANVCPTFAGSKNLDNLAWIAHNRNIGSFSKTTASTVAPYYARDFITTYVVFNGESNGQDGECDSQKLLSNTAINGGTTLNQANDEEGLRARLQRVFEEVAAQSASGTAASILSNSEGSGANLLQALFFPKKEFEAGSSVLWSGELHNLWYYFNPLLTTSSVREDTLGANQLDLAQDRIVNFFFDTDKQSVSYNQTMANRYQDVKGDDTTRAFVDRVTPDNVRSLWRAGKKLSERTDARTIYTPCLADSVNCNDGTTLGSSATRLIAFSTANGSRLQPYMETTGSGDGSETSKIIDYVHGADGDYRSRRVTIDGTPRTWRLGDIISSTPRLQSTTKLNSYDQPTPVGYNDRSYTAFTSTTDYRDKGMVYVGANDGMLHAFNLGVLYITPSGTVKATISDTAGIGLGTEAWAFIPNNALPYLRYLSCKSGSPDAFCNNADYSHLYYVDGQTTIVDASIGKPSTCTESDIANCLKINEENWRSVLITGMGLGGASGDSTTCPDESAGNCVRSPLDGKGLSSYFALDVTDPVHPTFKWEFSDAAIPDAEATQRGLGFATSGAATVRISARSDADDPNTANRDKNGKWFAVFGSGPTGPINKTTHQFLGTSKQPLKIYVVDLNATPPFALNSNYWVLDKVYDSPTDTVGTTLANAFVGSMSNAAIDTDRAVSTSTGFYSDDALYFGYVQQTGSTSSWESGGVLRLVTNEDPNPAHWRLSKVMDNMGPVVTAIARLQDRKNKELWLYFGAGRYFFKDDDLDTSRRIYAIKEPCYHGGTDLDPTCYTKLTPASLENQTAADRTKAQVDAAGGWYIGLEGQNIPAVGYGAERIISDPVALTNGAVFFTSFKPTTDVCGFGGNSYLWATSYDTGLQAPTAALQGRALIQLSTGEFKEVDLAGAFTDKDHRRMAAPMTGKPPSDPPPLVSKSNLKPVKKILHIQEK